MELKGFDADATIRGELRPQEEFLWAGLARSGIFFRAGDWIYIPLALLWCGFVVFWLISFIDQRQEEGLVEAAFLSIFLLAGLYFLAGRFLVDAYWRRRTCYGVSNERVIIVSRLRSRVVQSLNLDTLTNITLAEHSDGSGSISFGPGPHYWDWNMQACPGACFELAKEVRLVYEVILKARRGQGRTDFPIHAAHQTD